MGKKQKIIIGAIVVFILLFVLLSVFKNKETLSEKVGNYIESKGFAYNKENKTYSKLLSTNTLDQYYNDFSENSEYKELFFNLDLYQMNEVLYRNISNIKYSLNAIYDYTTSNTTYSYVVDYNDTSYMVKGSLNDTFTCDVSYYKNSSINKEDICALAKIDVMNFKISARDSLANYTLLKEIQK